MGLLYLHLFTHNTHLASQEYLGWPEPLTTFDVGCRAKYLALYFNFSFDAIKNYQEPTFEILYNYR
jgi:hypothetical protein